MFNKCLKTNAYFMSEFRARTVLVEIVMYNRPESGWDLKFNALYFVGFFFGSLAVRGCMPNTFYLHRLKLHAQSMDEYFYDFSSHVSKLYVFRFPFTFATTFVWNNVGLNGCCLNVNKYVFFVCLYSYY